MAVVTFILGSLSCCTCFTTFAEQYNDFVFSCEVGYGCLSDTLVSQIIFLMADVVIECCGYSRLQNTSLIGHILQGNVTN